MDTTQTYQPKNKWKLVAICFIVATLILGVSTLLLATKRDGSSKSNSAVTTPTAKTPSTSDTANTQTTNDSAELSSLSDTPSTSTAPSDDRSYLNISEWGVKIPLATGLRDVSYEIQGGIVDIYAKLSPKLASTDGRSADPFAGARVAGVERNNNEGCSNTFTVGDTAYCLKIFWTSGNPSGNEHSIVTLLRSSFLSMVAVN
ncbi:MAG: hypothetical protein LBN05_03405 [Oscillospiraceae bacterium]|jgi:hypothetical protein|nr:hypothetical protein [Oscillospiraceae bacterium]